MGVLFRIFSHHPGLVSGSGGWPVLPVRLHTGSRHKAGMTMIVALLIPLFFALPAFAAKPLVADLSAYKIAINSDFRGTRLFLFGARGSVGQVVVAVRGPDASYIVRKKERVFGMWLVRKQAQFQHVPHYYAIYSTAPLDLLTTPDLRRALGLGLGALSMAAKTSDPRTAALSSGELDAFRVALREQKARQLLYSEQTTPVRFIGETLFKAALSFPDSIQPGNYVADVYLLDGSGIVASQSVPIRVRKRGLEAALSEAAHDFPLLYGLASVALAMLAGWGAHRAFRRVG